MTRAPHWMQTVFRFAAVRPRWPDSRSVLHSCRRGMVSHLSPLTMPPPLSHHGNTARSSSPAGMGSWRFERSRLCERRTWMTPCESDYLWSHAAIRRQISGLRSSCREPCARRDFARRSSGPANRHSSPPVSFLRFHRTDLIFVRLFRASYLRSTSISRIFLHATQRGAFRPLQRNCAPQSTHVCVSSTNAPSDAPNNLIYKSPPS